MAYGKLIIGPSGSGKTNYLFNSIQRDNNIADKICLYAKDLEEPKYELLIDKREKAGINFNNDHTAFIEYSNSMDDILSDIADYQILLILIIKTLLKFIESVLKNLLFF